VVECCRLPGGCRVALLACLRHAQGRVIGIVGLSIIRQMAANAGCRCTFELSPDVTGRAWQSRVHAGQGKSGGLQVVELHVQPRVHVMALLARS